MSVLRILYSFSLREQFLFHFNSFIEQKSVRYIKRVYIFQNISFVKCLQSFLWESRKERCTLHVWHSCCYPWPFLSTPHWHSYLWFSWQGYEIPLYVLLGFVYFHTIFLTHNDNHFGLVDYGPRSPTPKAQSFRLPWEKLDILVYILRVRNRTGKDLHSKLKPPAVKYNPRLWGFNNYWKGILNIRNILCAA